MNYNLVAELDSCLNYWLWFHSSFYVYYICPSAIVTNLELTQKKRKRKRGDSGGRVDSEEDGDKKKKKKESQRPNYFVSIPITNAQVQKHSAFQYLSPSFCLISSWNVICPMTDKLRSDSGPRDGASAGTPIGQSHDPCPNSSHHSISHSSGQSGSSRSVSACIHQHIHKQYKQT